MSAPHFLSNKDRSSSLEVLEGLTWQKPDFFSYVVTTSHAIRKKPLATLSDEEIRLGLGQHVGVHYLVPLAIERLEADPLLEARLYPGDLPEAVLNVPRDYWDKYMDQHREMEKIAQAAWEESHRQFEIWDKAIRVGFCKAYDHFKGYGPSRSWIRPNMGRSPA